MKHFTYLLWHIVGSLLSLACYKAGFPYMSNYLIGVIVVLLGWLSYNKEVIKNSDFIEILSFRMAYLVGYRVQ